MTGTALYVRQSEDKTGHAAAVQRQEHDCRLLAEAKGWVNPERYADNSISATNGKARPEFERLLGNIEAGRVQRVVVWHLDRLTRSMADLTRIIKVGQRHGVNIAGVHGVSLDLGDPTGVAVAQILTAIAGMETAHKGERQRRANRQRAEAGQAFWSRRPFGYDRTATGDVFLVEDEAAAIRDAAGLVLSGATLSSVVRKWNAAGLRTTAGKGGLWGVTQLRRLLLNPRYAGQRIYNGEDMGEGAWAPILPVVQSKELEILLTAPGRRSAPADLTARYLLSGILECGVCGRKLFAAPVKSKGREWMVYRCLGGYCLSRKLEPVDELAEALVIGRLSMPDAAGLFRAGADVAALRARAAALRDRRDDLAALLADGLLSRAAVREQAGRLGAELEGVTAEIEATSAAAGPAAVLAGAEDVGAAWAALPVASKRQVIRSLLGLTLMPAGRGIGFEPKQLRVEWKGRGDA